MIGYLADFLFPRERAQSPVKSLSGGERNRLLLARLFARPANVLVLDEPTNDLDIETLELLEELIGDFDGTVLLVSHDRVVPRSHRHQHARVRRQRTRRRSTSAATTTTCVRSRQPIGKKPNQRRQSAPTGGQQAASRTAAAAAQSSPTRSSASWKALPARIAVLEDEQKRLQQESDSPEFYKADADHIRTVLARLEALGPELDGAARALGGTGRRRRVRELT